MTRLERATPAFAGLCSNPTELHGLAEGAGVESADPFGPPLSRRLAAPMADLPGGTRRIRTPGAFAHPLSRRAHSTALPSFLADTVGFEPTGPCSPRAFQARPFNHSGKSPGGGGGIRTARPPGYEPGELTTAPLRLATATGNRTRSTTLTGWRARHHTPQPGSPCGTRTRVTGLRIQRPRR